MLPYDSWATGIVFDGNKTEMLTIGNKQTWYSFNSALKEHLSCSLLRSGGKVHLKAKQHQMESLKQENRRLDVNANVASAIEVCKIKSAALSFEHVLGLVSFCGGEVGNIGHGR